MSVKKVSFFEDEPQPESREEEVASIWTSGHLCDFAGQHQRPIGSHQPQVAALVPDKRLDHFCQAKKCS